MSDVIDRNTLQLKRSADTAAHPDPPWLKSPDMSAVAGVPQIYWKITGDVISEMSGAEKAAVDLAREDAQRDSVANRFDNVEGIDRAFALTVLDELNQHALKITAILDAADNASNMGQFKTAVAAITDQPQRTIAQLKTALRNKLGS